MICNRPKQTISTSGGLALLYIQIKQSGNFLISRLRCRYVVSELATDITVIVGDVKFYLHKVC